MKGPRGNRPELFEPGARIVYVAERYSAPRPDGTAATKLRRERGMVTTQTENHVGLEGGIRVPKADVLGPDLRAEGEKLYRVVLHHAEGTRIQILQGGRTGDDARARSQAAADRTFGEGSWSVGGATLLREVS